MNPAETAVGLGARIPSSPHHWGWSSGCVASSITQSLQNQRSERPERLALKSKHTIHLCKNVTVIKNTVKYLGKGTWPGFNRNGHITGRLSTWEKSLILWISWQRGDKPPSPLARPSGATYWHRGAGHGTASPPTSLSGRIPASMALTVRIQSKERADSAADINPAHTGKTTYLLSLLEHSGRINFPDVLGWKGRFDFSPVLHHRREGSS